MAKAKGTSRSRAGAPSAARGRNGVPGAGIAAAALKPLGPFFSFFLTPGGLAVALLIIVAAALPWLQVLTVIDAFRRAVLEAMGMACYLLVCDLLLAVAVPGLWPRMRGSRTFWRV